MMIDRFAMFGVSLLIGWLAAPLPAQIRVQIGRPGVNVVDSSRQGTTNLFVEKKDRTRYLVEVLEELERGNTDLALRGLQELIELEEDSFVPVRKSDSKIQQSPDEEPPQPLIPGQVQPGGGFGPQLPDGAIEPAAPPETEPVLYRGLKAEVLRILGNLPPASRARYEQNYGQQAQRLLDLGLRGDFDALRDAVRLYFHTKAGHRAAYLLATYRLDRGEPFAAALMFDQLRKSQQPIPADWEPAFSLKEAVAWAKSGDLEAARIRLRELRERTGPVLRAFDQQVPLFEDGDDEIEWLSGLLGKLRQGSAFASNWMTLRGSPGGHTVSNPASLIWEPRWRAGTLDMANYYEETPANRKKRLAQAKKLIEESREKARESGLVLLPAPHPLVVGNLVLCRSIGRTVKAFDLDTGELVWETFFDRGNTYGEIIDPNSLPAPIRNPYQSNQSTDPLSLYLQEHAWWDLTGGTLTTEGEHVYALNRLGVVGTGTKVINSRTTSNNPNTNKLYAYAFERTGGIDWKVDGKVGSATSDALAGHFFLGPPLPLNGGLYVLAEAEGEIRLICLDGEVFNEQGQKTADVRWSQSLISPPDGVVKNPLRRLSGLTPAFADGVMVCPTSGGAIVAIDLSRRMLLWGYAYGTNVPDESSRLNRVRIMRQQNPITHLQEDRWVDSQPVITDGAVLVTPIDSDAIHCLSLVDNGRVLWKRPRGEGLYLAGVHDGVAVVVGKTEVKAYRIADGADAWSEPIPIPNPSGRGYLVDGYYHLPLSNGTIATIDMQAGAIRAFSQGPKDFVPGNLVAVDGRLVSQSPTEVVAFAPLSELEESIQQRLEQNPNDPVAIARNAELLLSRGETVEGLAELRKALKNSNDEQLRQRFAELLLELLRTDADTELTSIAEAQQYAVTPEQKGRLVRYEALGLKRSGNQIAAFDQFLNFGMGTGSNLDSKLSRITGSLSVRSDRWAQRHLTDLLTNATPDAREQMNERIQERLLAATADRDADRLRRLIGILGEGSLAMEARMRLVHVLDPAKQSLELVNNLDRLRESEDIEQRAYATARLAELYRRYEHWESLGKLTEELATVYTDQPIFDGRDGADLAKQILSEAEVQAQLDRPQTKWPSGGFEVQAKRQSNSVQTLQPLAVAPITGSRFQGWRFGLDSNRQKILGYDPSGAERISIPLKTRISTSYLSGAAVYDHLMVLAVGGKFWVYDLLGDGNTPSQLWEGILIDDVDPNKVNSLNFRGGFGRNMLPANRILMDMRGLPVGRTGPLTNEVLVYQKGTSLFGADVLNGETIWERRNVPRGLILFGNEESFISYDAKSKLLTVYRTGDGVRLAVRNYDPDGEVALNPGETTILEESRGEKNSQVIQLVDLITGKPIWSKTFPADTEFKEAADDEIAAFEPNGRLRVLRRNDGTILLDQTVRVPDLETNTFQTFHIDRSPSRYLFLTQYTRRTANVNMRKRTVSAVGLSPVMLRGPAVSFDRKTGKPVWSTWIDETSCSLSQCGNLPVLVLAARINQWRTLPNQLRRISSAGYECVLLDRRNGKKIYSENFDNQVNLTRYNLKTKPEQGEISVQFYKLLLTVKTTDKPLGEPVTWDGEVPPDPSEEDEEEKEEKAEDVPKP